MKTIRIVLWVAVVLASIGAAYLFSQNAGRDNSESALKLGAPFDLVTHRGDRITEAALQGRPHAIFFGFTRCPDVCPVTLQDVTVWLKELGEDGDKLDFYFFSADPERDTVEVLANYIGVFDDRITGVTGDAEQLAMLAKAYKIYIKKVDLGDGDGDYTIDHTASIFLFDGEGYLKGTISYGEAHDIALDKLKRLIGGTKN